MRIEQVRMTQDADQARRLQALLGFKEQFISQTLAAQVIGGTGSELSRSIYIDKGKNDGIKRDMAVITKDGIVGKILYVYPSTSLVLLVDDQTSGVGAILEKSRLQGILRGTSSGEVVLEKVMSDETVPVGEQVLTSGGDGIFPKGLPVGTVTKVSPGKDLFLNIRVRPAVDLNRLEEVLVVTRIDERQAQPDETGPVRAIDILAQRLPTVPPKPDAATDAAGKGSAAGPPSGVANQRPVFGPPLAQSTPGPIAAKPDTGSRQANTVSTQANTASQTAVSRTGKVNADSASAVAAQSSSPNSQPSLTQPSVTKKSANPVPATGNSAPPAAAKKPVPKPANPTAATVPPKPQTASQDTPQ
jgi:rod shape-determining protein MreC